VMVDDDNVKPVRTLAKLVCFRQSN
jgi:hypothetical protein